MLIIIKNLYCNIFLLATYSDFKLSYSDFMSIKIFSQQIEASSTNGSIYWYEGLIL